LTRPSPLLTVGLDADDTLWRTEPHFRLTQARFAEWLAPFASPETLQARLTEVEARNLRLYGYGVKGFTLSMIETAMEFAAGADATAAIREILAAGREMLNHPVEPLPGVAETLASLADRYRLVLITKGDLLHQERKLAASGLGDHFSAVEVVSEKDAAVYVRVFARHGAGPERSAMVGDSVRSDILPALEAGAFAAHVPPPFAWSHEVAAAPVGHPRFAELPTITDLPAWLRRCEAEVG
jgi:putative hydrolase of the HAD superfamily